MLAREWGEGGLSPVAGGSKNQYIYEGKSVTIIKFSNEYTCRTSPHLSCRYICTCKKAVHAQSYSLQPCLQQ